jgi:O-acetyl-ADP-ribose deacetylase
MAAIIPLSEIPTLSLLYKLKKLQSPTTSSASSATTTATVEPSQAFNDKIALIRHDITKLGVDSIVNAANESLLGGGGVDGAIHRAAGPELFQACSRLGGCDTGSAKITDGFRLPCNKVIHAVGPVYYLTKEGGECTRLLRGCYRKSLELAVENGCASIAFAALSTGVYGYPSGEAAETAIAEVRSFLEEGKGEALERIVFCNFMEKDEAAYLRTLP